MTAFGLIAPWGQVDGREDVRVAEAPTYPGGPTLVLSVHQADADLWNAVVAYKDELALTWQCPSGFATRLLAQQWAENKAHAIAAEAQC